MDISKKKKTMVTFVEAKQMGELMNHDHFQVQQSVQLERGQER